MPRTRREQEKRRVGIWIRVSTEDQARGESPEHHQKRAEYYAQSKDWEVITVYHLEGVSGKSVIQHPEAQRMLADMREGKITALIFSKIARLARNTKELLDLADEFESHDADLVSLQESIDTSTPAGRLFYTVIAALAEWERSEIATRVAASVPIRAKLGKSLGGAAPFGYRWDDRRLVIDEKEAPIRRLLFELFLEHRRKRTVARILNDAGHRTRNGGKFNATGVERLLADPIAKGTRRMNYRTSPGHGSALKKPSEWVYVDAPALVSDELWEACNDALKSQKSANGKPVAKKTAHLFSGLLFCQCGTKMYVPSGGKSYRCGKCKNRVSEEDLELVFIEQLKGFVLSPEQVSQHLQRADEQIAANLQMLQTLEGERSRVSSEMEKIYRLYVDERISGQLFADRNTPLEERFRQLDDEVPRLQAEVDILKLQIASSDEVLAEARDLYGRWPTLSFEERRQIIEAITDRILVADNEITVQLAYLPTPAHSSPAHGRKGGANGSHTVTDSWRR